MFWNTLFSSRLIRRNIIFDKYVTENEVQINNQNSEWTTSFLKPKQTSTFPCKRNLIKKVGFQNKFLIMGGYNRGRFITVRLSSEQLTRLNDASEKKNILLWKRFDLWLCCLSTAVLMLQNSTKFNKILRLGSYSISNVTSKQFHFRQTLVSLQAKLGLNKAVKKFIWIKDFDKRCWEILTII